MIKKFLLLFLPVSVLLGAVFWLFYHSDIKAQEQLILSELRAHVTMQSNTIAYHFETIVSDLAILSELHKLRNGDYSPKHMEEHFISLSLKRGVYDQIRFIYKDGQEILRVNYNNGKAELVPKNKLQNKANRYYFKETMIRAGGEVYISPLDLNIEKGEIEEPFKPMIRIGIPVLDSKGEKLGVLIINLLAKWMIDDFKTATHHSQLGQQDSLLNSEGYWLASPKPENEFGFMLEERKGKTFGNTHPKQWERVLSEDTGQFQTDDGFFTFTTLYPLLLIKGSKDLSEKAYSVSLSDAKTYFWKIVSFVHQEALNKTSYEKSRALRNRLIKLYSALLLLISFGIFYIVLIMEERNQIQKNLKKSEELTKAIVTTVGEGIISIDTNSIINFVNKELCDIFGYVEKELVGKNIKILIPEKYLEEATRCMENYLKSGEAKVIGKRVEMEGLRKNGTLFAIEFRIEESSIDNKRQFTGAIRDITKRKKIENSLRRSRESLKKAQKIAKIGSWGWDIAKNEMHWSNQVYAIFGYSPQEFVATYEGLIKRTHEDDAEFVKKSIYQNLFDRKPLEIDFRIVLPDGTEKTVHLQDEVTYDDKGEPTQLFGTIQDITVQKKNEETHTKAMEEAEEATKLKDKYVSLVAHDLKGPLGLMLGFLQLVRDDVAEPPGEGQKLILDRAIETGQNMTMMIEDILSISRIQTRNLVPILGFMDASRIAVKMMVDFEHPAKEKGIMIINKVPEQSCIYADKAMLNQVITNLVSNAIKFCNKGNSITLYIPDGESSTFAVKDTGLGMNSEQQKILFDHDKATSTTGTAGEIGTGFGMPLSWEIMQAHGGELVVESKEGQGTTFYARLPHVKPRILIVDDDEATHDLLLVQLKGLSAEITVAKNGEEALQAARSNRPHLIIADLYMPVMDGFELISCLKKNSNTDSIPIMVITSDTSPGIRQNSFKLGVQELINKPLVENDILQIAKRLIGYI